MEDRRKLTRKYLAFFTRVFDYQTGQLLGHLDNVSADGAMIIGQVPIESDKTFHLQMELSEYFFGKDFLDFQAKSVWCQPDLDPSFYNTGLQFLDIAPEDTEIIQRIMEKYGIHE